MSEKVHPPTPRRRQQAKEQGRVPRSNEVVSAGLLLASTMMLSWIGPRLVSVFLASITAPLQSQSLEPISPNDAFQMIFSAISMVGLAILPLMIGIMFCGIAFNMMQTGLMMVPSKLVPSTQRISPINRLQTIFSVRSLSQFLISLFKLLAIAAVGITVMRNHFDQLLRLTEMPMAGIATTTFRILIDGSTWMGATLLGIASVDYSIARWQHERDLMMTEQELREEIRDAQRSAPSNSPQPTPARSQAIQAVA